jgi:peroxiredoxin
MRTGLLPKLALVAVLVTVTVAFAQQGGLYLPVDSEAPAITGTANDGQAYVLSDLIKERPAFVVFWKGVCPSNTRAAPLFNDLKKAYGDKATLIGVVSTTSGRLGGWADQFSVNYPILADAELGLVGEYKVVRSICTFEIGTDGKIVRVFEGFGQEALKSLNEAMAKAAGVPMVEVDLSGAPYRQTWG